MSQNIWQREYLRANFRSILSEYTVTIKAFLHVLTAAVQQILNIHKLLIVHWFSWMNSIAKVVKSVDSWRVFESSRRRFVALTFGGRCDLDLPIAVKMQLIGLHYLQQRNIAIKVWNTLHAPKLHSKIYSGSINLQYR